MRTLALLIAVSLCLSTVNSTCTSAPSGSTLSPIDIATSLCGPYNSFKANLADSTTGGFSSYTGSSIELDGVTYDTQVINLYTPSLHKLGGVNAELELQIEAKSSSNEYLILAVLFDKSSNSQGLTQSLNTINILSTTTKLSTLSAALNMKDSMDIWLNLYEYSGTVDDGSSNCEAAKTLVYGSVLPADSTQYATYSGAATAGTSASGAAQTVARLCFTGYFYVRMDHNYGLWFAVVITLLFFIMTLSMDPKPMHNFDYKEDPWTHHPFVSVKRIGNDFYTRKSRASQIFMSLITFCLFNSVWYRVSSSPSEGSNVISYALASLPISWVIGYMVGYFLRKYYLMKYESESRENEEERGQWDDKAQFWLFLYYISVFAWVWIGFSFCVWNMNELKSWEDKKPSNLWVASFFLDIGLEYLIFDPLVCFIATKSAGLLPLLRWKGLLYDDVCHKTYLCHLKRE